VSGTFGKAGLEHESGEARARSQPKLHLCKVGESGDRRTEGECLLGPILLEARINQIRRFLRGDFQSGEQTLEGSWIAAFVGRIDRAQLVFTA